MKKQLSTLSLLTLGLSLALPSVALAAPDTGWTKSTKLYEVRTWTGQPQWGHTDGTLKSATLFHPRSVVVLPDGKLLVADRDNHLLREVSTDKVSTYGGLIVGQSEPNTFIGAYNDDAKAQAAFNRPAGLATDAQGNIYVADSGNHAIRKISKDGKVTTLAGNGVMGSKDATGKEASFHSPSDVAVDSKGTVYVADTLNHTIRKVSSDGVVSTLTALSERVIEDSPGSADFVGDYADGAIAKAKFNEPSGLVVDAKDNLYVSDRGNQRIRYFDFAKGTVSTIAGGNQPAPGTSIYAQNASYIVGDFQDGVAANARFNGPEGLALTSDGSLLVADSENHAIRMIKDGQVTTVAGVPAEYGTADGVIGSARLNHPTDVALLADGRLAIADELGNKIRILQKYAKPAAIPADQSITVILNGSLVRTEVPAQAKASAVMLPVRSVGNALGYEVEFDKKTGAAILSKNGVVYTIVSGASTVTKTVNGSKQTLTLNAPAIEANNRLFLPVRFFASESGLDIQWDSEAKIVVIRDPIF
ncbi:stalk domain-containing protein [Cohnella cholangitidis]|uniref:Copper amine oxidase n=1 Tax=Cohnella cholangitidis TaxID=2598458 RepID=A0A7G5C3V3_9BACL|nr:stalk domain-containing protein [Cohnella cholangitidis]QMV43887.1 copper amine oxidase [Cohnella cholangitidis]